MVSAERATLARAPGGSFICPNTSAVFLSTLLSSISLYRSLPSLERSPTPANTEYPLCSVAMFRISSWIITVFPTPAPPKSPTLPPLRNGQIRSITLIPVSSISLPVVCEVSGGESLCIESFSLPSTAGLPSIALPVTSNILPRTLSPTGTDIGAPVAVTSLPRESPSVVLIAMVRTSFIPKCCCVSSTIVFFSVFISSASKILGKSPSNFTSTTGPIIFVIIPFDIFI